MDKTNAIIEDFREILKDVPNNSKVPEEYRQQILQRINSEKGFVDCVTISSSILFSAKYVTEPQDFEKQAFYNNVKQSDYVVDGYLEGVERVRMDYRELYRQYAGRQDVVFLIDPPYLSTDVSTYSKEDYWKLSDYLNVLKCLKNGKYFYFTSNKSQILELCDWMETNGDFNNPFHGATVKTVNTTLNHTAKYTDIMIYKN